MSASELRRGERVSMMSEVLWEVGREYGVTMSVDQQVVFAGYLADAPRVTVSLVRRVAAQQDVALTRRAATALVHRVYDYDRRRLAR